MRAWITIGLLVLLFPALGKAQTANNTRTGSDTFTGGLNSTKFQNIIIADQQTGADCGAKINAADTALGANPGEIWVTQLCGTAWTTAITINTGHILVFHQGGTYTSSAIISLPGHNAGIIGTPQAMAANTVASGFGSQVFLQEANSANLAELIHFSGNFPILQDIQIDGNYTNNSSGGVAVLYSSSQRPEISRVTIGNAKTHGLELDNVGNSPKIFKLIAYQNQQDGLYCNGSASGGGDGFVTDSEFEANQGNGIELSNCPAWRIEHSDFGLNSQGVSGSCGLKIYGTVWGGQANNENININQFGNNFRDDVCIIGYNGGNTSLGNNIVGNIFVGSTSMLAANTYSEIKLTDGGQDIINSNILSATPSPTNACGISINETSSGRFLPSQTLPNTYTPANAWGTSGYCDNTANKSSGFALPVSGTANGNVLLISPILPTVTSGFNSGSTGGGNGTLSFVVNVGTGAAGSTGTLGLPTAANGWICSAQNQTRADTIQQTATTITSVTLTNYGTTFAATNWTNSDVLLISCFAR